MHIYIYMIFLKVYQQYLHRITWCTSTYGITLIGLLLYRLDPMSQRFTFMFSLGSNDFFYDRRTMYGWGHGYSFASSVDHLRSDSVELLVYDSMRQYPGHRCCLQVPQDNVNPIKKGLRA
jgi:hypothetical protein